MRSPGEGGGEDKWGKEDGVKVSIVLCCRFLKTLRFNNQCILNIGKKKNKLGKVF